MLDLDQLQEHLNCRGVQVALGIATIGLITYIALKIRTRAKKSALRKKWENAGKDVVVLHQHGRARFCPSGSPYPIKLETFLRMHNIKYVNDFKEPMSSKGKMPWITFNGQEIADTQIVIEFLTKKFNLDVNPGLSEEEKAVSRAMRFMIEQDLYWVLVHYRWLLHKGQHLPDFFASATGSVTIDRMIYKSVAGNLKKQAHGQGMGRHSKEEVEQMGIDDLKALSTFLGTKKFIMGDQPTELDAVLFGFMCMLLYCCPKHCPYTRKIEQDLTNLVDHAERMIAKYWPDWQSVLLKQ